MSADDPALAPLANVDAETPTPENPSVAKRSNPNASAIDRAFSATVLPGRGGL